MRTGPVRAILGAHTHSPGLSCSAWRASCSGEDTLDPLADAGGATATVHANRNAAAPESLIALLRPNRSDDSGLGRGRKAGGDSWNALTDSRAAEQGSAGPPVGSALAFSTADFRVAYASNAPSDRRMTMADIRKLSTLLDDPALAHRAGCFASLHELHTHRLRGCVGQLEARDPIPRH